MGNIYFLILLLVTSFLLLALSYRLFGLIGIYVYVIVCVISANIQVNKFVHYFSIGDFTIDATLGNVMFGTVFLATDFINERYGKREAHQVVYYSIFANISFVLVMIGASLFQQLNVDEYSLLFNQSFDALFSLNGNVAKAVLIGNLVYLASQTIDILIYKKLKELWPSQMALLVRNNVSTIVSQLFDSFTVTALFCFAGIIPSEYFLSVVASTLAIKTIIALLDTPFLYLMIKLKPNPKIKTRLA